MTHILAKSKLNTPGDETVANTYSCGEELMPIIQNSLGTKERSEFCPCLIISKRFLNETRWFNYLHRNNDFGFNAATIKAIKLIEALYCEEAKTYYLSKYFCCTGQDNYCRATTW